MALYGPAGINRNQFAQKANVPFGIKCRTNVINKVFT